VLLRGRRPQRRRGVLLGRTVLVRRRWSLSLLEGELLMRRVLSTRPSKTSTITAVHRSSRTHGALALELPEPRHHVLPAAAQRTQVDWRVSVVVRSRGRAVMRGERGGVWVVWQGRIGRCMVGEVLQSALHRVLCEYVCV